MEENIISGIVGAGGAYAAVWAHLGFIKWRLNEQKEAIVELIQIHKENEKRLLWLEAQYKVKKEG